MARSGFSAAKLLSKHNNEILITDMKEQSEKDIAELKKLGVTFIQSNSPEDLFTKDFDVVIKNPGIHPKKNVQILPVFQHIPFPSSFP